MNVGSAQYRNDIIFLFNIEAPLTEWEKELEQSIERRLSDASLSVILGWKKELKKKITKKNRERKKYRIQNYVNRRDGFFFFFDDCCFCVCVCVWMRACVLSLCGWVGCVRGGTENNVRTQHKQQHLQKKKNRSEGKFMEANTKQMAAQKFRCTLCSKMFKGAKFIHKHIRNKHLSDVEANVLKVRDEQVEFSQILFFFFHVHGFFFF